MDLNQIGKMLESQAAYIHYGVNKNADTHVFEPLAI